MDFLFEVEHEVTSSVEFAPELVLLVDELFVHVLCSDQLGLNVLQLLALVVQRVDEALKLVLLGLQPLDGDAEVGETGFVGVQLALQGLTLAHHGVEVGLVAQTQALVLGLEALDLFVELVTGSLVLREVLHQLIALALDLVEDDEFVLELMNLADEGLDLSLELASLIVPGLLLVVQMLLLILKFFLKAPDVGHVFIALSLPVGSSVFHFSVVVSDGPVELVLKVTAALLGVVDLAVEAFVERLHLLQVGEGGLQGRDLSVAVVDREVPVVDGVVPVADLCGPAVNIVSELVVLGHKVVLVLLVLGCEVGGLLGALGDDGLEVDSALIALLDELAVPDLLLLHVIDGVDFGGQGHDDALEMLDLYFLFGEALDQVQCWGWLGVHSNDALK